MDRQKTDLDYDFLRAWKTEDKDWMKERRKGWKTIQIQLDRMKEADGNMFGRLPKKNYKYLKNYYLTGRDKPEKNKKVELVTCLMMSYDPAFEADVLLQF